jgi:hypothetical protein
MRANYQHCIEVATRVGGALETSLHMLMETCKVTVLVLLMTRPVVGETRADDNSRLCVLEFTCELQIPMGRGRLDGVFVSDGVQSRLATYWVEPSAFRESPFLLRYADLIVSNDVAHCWIHGHPSRDVIRFSSRQHDSLLPQDNSLEEIARCSLNLMSHMSRGSEEAGVLRHMETFFQEARGHGQSSQRASIDGNTPANEASSRDTLVPSELSSERRYSRETLTDGHVVWQILEAWTGRPVVKVTVMPKSRSPTDGGSTFDPNNLGSWAFVPEAYRTYWAFDQAYSDLTGSSEISVRSQKLCAEIECYLQDRKPPSCVVRGLNRLWFKSAMMTDDPDSIRKSAQACIQWLCRDDSLDAYQRLLESTRICGQIEKAYPRQSHEWLRPFVEQIATHTPPNVKADSDKIMMSIISNGWFTYGQLLLEELRARNPTDAEILDAASVKLETTRIARTRNAPDPCDAPPSVKWYLGRLDQAPQTESLTMDDIRLILNLRLSGSHALGGSQGTCTSTEEVIRMIRLLVGEGPFRGDQSKLLESVARFSERHLSQMELGESMNTLLATFLALSFCDVSTEGDHGTLVAQFRSCSATLRSQIIDMLKARQLDSLVSSEDMTRILSKYDRIFQQYVDDPLWPPFKFPLTSNEEARLASALRLRAMRLAPVFDDISAKVIYGGASAQLKEKAITEIAIVVQSLLPQLAFLRDPPYPGVSIKYLGGYGFIAAVPEQLYEEKGRSQEVFKAMKYFHLGHRLQEIVENERERLRTIVPQGVTQ